MSVRRSVPTIYVDLDGMVANLLEQMIDYWNEDHGTSLDIDTVWNAPDVVPRLDECLVRDHVFADLEPLPGFAEALPELQDMGHVIIASAPSRNPDSATDKIRWVLDRFPSIKRQDIILLKHKHLLRGEVWLDDWEGNIRAVRATHPVAFIGAIAYPYNQRAAEHLDVRADGYLDTAGAWQELVAAVRRHLETP